MITTQTISKNSLNSGQLFFGSPARSSYLWNNLIIEKRISVGWLYKLYEDSIIHDIVLVLTSPAH
jgi:hypothetical protein